MLLAFLLMARTVLAADPPKLVAVLPIADMGGTVDRLARDTIEETIRTVGGDLLTPHGFVVLTGENTLKILSDNGVDPAKACETECALAAARELKANLFISGSASKLEGQIIVFVRLYDAASGAQISSLKLESDLMKGIRTAFEEKAPAFFEKAWRNAPVASGSTNETQAGLGSQATAAGGTWSVKFDTPDAHEPWSLLDAKLNPVCATLPCHFQLPPAIDYKFRRNAAQRTDVIDVEFKGNLDELGFTRGQSLRAVPTKDWGKAAGLGYGIVGGSIFGAGAITGLAMALAAGWRPWDWFESSGNYFWAAAGVGTAVAAITGTIVFLATNPQRITIETDSAPSP